MPETVSATFKARSGTPGDIRRSTNRLENKGGVHEVQIMCRRNVPELRWSYEAAIVHKTSETQAGFILGRVL